MNTLPGEAKQPVSIGARHEESRCKCFSSPPESPFIKGDVYQWGFCIDGKIVSADSGEQWTFGDFEFFKYFIPMTGV